MTTLSITAGPYTFRARLEEIGVITQAVGAHLGVFIDSPGERVFLIDQEGRVLQHDVAFAVLAQLALVGKPGLLLGPASASLAFSKIAEQLESRFVPTKSTPGSVLRSAQHTETVLASDGVGGYCWPEFQLAFDAVYTTAKLLELLASSGVGLRELIGHVPRVGYERAVIFCPWEAKGRVMRVLAQDPKTDATRQIDGVKHQSDGEWVLVLPDADRPLFNVYAEAREEGRAWTLAHEYAERLEQLRATA